MKPKFIQEGKEIYFQDKNGKKWNKESIAELFETCDLFVKMKEKLEYYANN
ncbi:hypothetical protein HYT52_03700 [Candidatus Woesearchaeota archaeon]|nr:hypothetical protein [Candidatus Woesearchaeota archaeon]